MNRWPENIEAPSEREQARSPRREFDPRVSWLAWREAGPFRVWHKAYRSDFEQTRHAHATGSVDFNLAGGGAGMYLGRTRNSRPGGIEYYRPDGEHSFRTGSGGIRVLHVIFDESMVTPDGVRGGDDGFEPDEARGVGLATRILRELSDPDASSGLAMESAAHELLAAMRRWPATASIGSRAVGDAVEALRGSPTEAIGLRELGGLVGLHPAHLARAFRAAMGVSPGEYHRQVRLARAAQSLAISDKPIAGVAGDCGFADQAHLTRWFTRALGVSPASYRRALRGA